MLLMLFLESQEFYHLPFGNYFNKFYKNNVVGKKKSMKSSNPKIAFLQCFGYRRSQNVIQMAV